MTDTRRAYLGLGSNEGDRLSALQAAVDGLGQTPGVTVTAVSPVYETEPVGGPSQAEYLNAVAAIDTNLSPRELLTVAKRLEAEAGRKPGGERWGPRPLDVDILLVGHELVNDEDLVVPARASVRAPLRAGRQFATSVPWDIFPVFYHWNLDELVGQQPGRRAVWRRQAGGGRKSPGPRQRAGDDDADLRSAAAGRAVPCGTSWPPARKPGPASCSSMR